MSERDDDGRAVWRYVTDLFLSADSHDRFLSACKAAGLPHPGALRVLLQLRRAEPPTMGGLAGFMSCDASYATALVDALENLGYVERRTSSTDRRVKHVHLTAAGAAAQEKALDVLATPPTALQRLDPSERRTLARLLAKLGADQPAGRGAPPGARRPDAGG
jgi:DNA-binding MarR family transcriptional regulator